MENIVKLIEKLLSEPKGQTKYSDKVYKEEPILRTASQMANFLPPEYRKMRKIAKAYGVSRQSEAYIFWKQGKFMEAFEDNYDYQGKFLKYFPTYQLLNDYQLRGYFSWRTKVRRGQIEPASLSFAFLYIFELLNQIGVSTADEGFHTLKSFWEAYREFDNHIDRYLRLWLNDYVVYYGLDPSFFEASDIAFDKSLLVLFHRDLYSEDEVFEALRALSSYHVETSKFYKQNPDDFKTVACRVFHQLSLYYEKKGQKSYAEKLFGRKTACPYHMFSSAVFYDRMKYKNYHYVVDGVQQYRCKNGMWVCEKHFGNRGKNKELGALLRVIDCLMRQKYDYKYLLKQDDTTKLVLNIVEREINRFLAWKKESEAPKIEIDFSKLQGIRQAATVTRDKLIVEEEVETPRPEEAPPVATEPEEPPAENEAGLSPVEYAFMKCLLLDKPYHNLIKENGLMLSVLVDGVNEKFYDTFGDTVIVFEGDSPELLEDYREDLKGVLKL